MHPPHPPLLDLPLIAEYFNQLNSWHQIFFETYVIFTLAVFEENLKMAVLVYILLRMPDYHYELFQKKDL